MVHNASHRFARIAPRKARLVADLIRGMPIDQAMTELSFSKKRSAWYFKSLLKSAIANAEERDADVAGLVVCECRVDEGPTIKRWRPKDRGRAHPIMKRTSHLHIALDERT
ncbi:MAG: 50S ribosomal protein L22 [Planctomycetota bacterium]|jgi:large subunit ribosomal protein L22